MKLKLTDKNGVEQVIDAIALAGAVSSGGKDAGLMVVADLPVQPGDDSNLDVKRVADGFLYKNFTSSGICKDGAGYIAGVMVTGGAATTVTIHDNTAASGVLLYKSAAVDASATTVLIEFPKPIKFNIGTYVTIGGTSAELNVLYI